MGQVRTRRVVLQVMYVVPLELGATLPAGIYDGIAKETSAEDAGEGRTEWSEPRYIIELDAKELERMGRHHSSEISVEYDVSRFVRVGDILVE
jgi:hypothetical protein